MGGLGNIAEPGHEEWMTRAFLERAIVELGLRAFRVGNTSLVVPVGSTAKPPVLIRADMDGVSVDSGEGRVWRHTCGHHAHMTAALLVLLAHEDLQRKGIGALVVFQEAEESSSSGAPLVVEGLRSLRLPMPRLALGWHVWPELAAGQVGVRPGVVFPSVNGVEVHFTGQPGLAHGSAVGRGAGDALDAAVNVYQALRALPSGRYVTAQHEAVLHMGRLEAGSRPNDVARTASILGTLRANDPQARIRFEGTIGSAVDSISMGFEGSVKIEFAPDIRPELVNDPEPSSALRDAAHRLGLSVTEYPSSPLPVSEDFGWYRRAGMASVFFQLGVQTNALLHTAGLTVSAETPLAAADIMLQTLESL